MCRTAPEYRRGKQGGEGVANCAPPPPPGGRKERAAFPAQTGVNSARCLGGHSGVAPSSLSSSEVTALRHSFYDFFFIYFNV